MMKPTLLIKKTQMMAAFFFPRKDRPWQIITSSSYSEHMYDLLFIETCNKNGNDFLDPVSYSLNQ